MQRLYDDLTATHRPRGAGGRARGWLRNRTEAVRGLYLWGAVGRGKTLLVDLFFDTLKEARLRLHFHAFMRRVHQDLKALRNESDPLQRVAGRLRAETRVLGLDEFHVGDITDAMILGKLLSALFDAGVTVIATSNEAPERLYTGGLQRDRFLPAIATIHDHMHVVELEGAVDYRLRTLERAEIYHTPLDAAADRSLRSSFDELAPEAGVDGVTIDIEGRPIKTVRHADGVAWFSFEELCLGPRAAADYIELARCYQTVLLSGIPRMDDLVNDAARRFVTLIDELYGRNVKLICSAAAEPEALYSGKRLTAMFARTASRLQEMRSRAYLARPHCSD